MRENRNSTFRLPFGAAPREPDSGRFREDAKALLSDLRPYAVRLTAFLAAALGAAVTFARLPALIGSAVDLFASVLLSSLIKGAPETDPAQLVPLLLRAVVLLLLNAAFTLLHGTLSARIASAYAHDLRGRVCGKILRVRIAWFDLHGLRETEALATEKIDFINQNLNLLLSQGIAPALLFTATLCALFRQEPVAALPFCAAALLTLLLCRRRPAPSQAAPAVDMDEAFRHLTALRVSGAAPALLADCAQAAETKEKEMRRALFSEAALQRLPVLLTGIALAVAVAAGVQGIAEGRSSLGALISVIFYAGRMERPLSQLSVPAAAFRVLTRTSAALFAFFRVPEENDGALPAPDTAAGLSLEHITFRYPTGRQDVFRDFSARIPSTGVTALTGCTGAGKTTLLHLLLRFYLPQGGTVRWGDTDVKSLDLNGYRAAFSVIEQEATLFPGTIAANISYPDPPDDPERIRAAAGAVGAAERILATENSWETLFSADPRNLSDGEIQQILLARALYHKKRFIVLDEATSCVDARQEAAFYRQLRRISQSCGVILISHRPGAEAWADAVIDIRQPPADIQTQ